MVITLSLMPFGIVLVMIAVYRKYEQLRTKYLNLVNVSETLLDITKEIFKLDNEDDLYNKLLDYTLKLIHNAEFGSILIYNKGKHCMDFRVVRGYNIEILKDVHLKKEELFLYAYNNFENAGIIENPLEFDKRLMNINAFETLKNSQALQMKSSLSVPLYVEGEFFGCINVDNYDAVNFFSKEDIEIGEYIGMHLEIVVQNFLLVNKMNNLLITDSLTGLLNRRFYTDIINKKYFNTSVPENETFVIIDLDEFKYINDTYGHAFGDEVLKYFSAFLISNLRKTDSIIRLSGDEFLIILSNCKKNIAEKIMKNMLSEISKKTFGKIKLDFSYGISTSDGCNTNEDLLKEADQNMYINKKQRKMAYCNKM